jgi:glycosyltransferase involved in cell wall biosynthesis
MTINNKKDVVWIINQFAGHPDSGWGERHYYLSKPALFENRVVIISAGNNHMFTQKIDFKGIFKVEKQNDIEFCWVNIPKYNPQSITRFLAMFVFALNLIFLIFKTKELGKPDYILVSSMSIFPYPIARLLKWWFKSKKLSFEVRDLWPLTPIYLMGYSRSNPMIWLIGILEKYAYNTADSIISLFEESKVYIDSISKRPKVFNCIPNGINISKDDSNGKSIELLLNKLPQDKLIICYAGTIGFANALDTFIEVLNKSKFVSNNYFALIIGDGYLKSNYSDELKNNSNVLFAGKQKKADIPYILSKADICFISWHDSPLYDYGVSANKYFDYMASGKPILSAQNGIIDPVAKSRCGIIVKNEFEGIEDGLKQFYFMSQNERINMGLLGEEYVNMHHSYNQLSVKFFKAIKGVEV